MNMQVQEPESRRVRCEECGFDKCKYGRRVKNGIAVTRRNCAVPKKEV